MDDSTFFDQRRHSQPQQVIDELVAQTGRQGAKIHELREQIAAQATILKKTQKLLDKMVAVLGGEEDAA